MAHNWPRLGRYAPSSTPRPASMFPLADSLCDDDTAWFDEGIAVYYGTLLPYRLGVCTASQFTAELNSHAQAHYTNPCVGLSNKETHKRASQASA